MNNSPAGQQAPSPSKIFDTLNAYQQTAALKTAIELDIFTAIEDGKDTAGTLAEHCKASEKGMRVLCDYLVIHEFLTKQNGKYGLTPDSAFFLSRKSPACLASATKFLCHPMFSENFKEMTAIVRKGGTVNAEGTVAPEHPVWVDFARAMAPMMFLPSAFIADFLGKDEGQPLKILDVAASHGNFGITLAKKFRNARVVALDWPNVLEVARENAVKAGVSDRHTLLPGSAFDVEYGTGYDIVLITNFLHHFDSATCEKFMRKVHAALKPGGRALTLEFVPNEDRVTPVETAGFAMIMLGSTPSGDAYTFSEYEQMFRNAGFSKNDVYPVLPTPEQLIVSHK